MHCCYVVTIDEKRTFYADLAYISVRALRLVHPKARITILVDEVTGPLLETQQHKILNYIDEMRVIQTGQPDPQHRSRFIKTSIRSLVAGDFLFIDVDAIPVRSLAPIFKMDCDVSMAIDNNYTPDREQLAPWVKEIYDARGWTYDAPAYYNSGVMFFRDTPGAHELGAMWHQRWLETVAHGCSKDQPSLNSCLPVVKPRIKVLPNRYNAMVFMGIEQTRNAAVLHFWISGREEAHYIIIDELYRRYKKTGDIDEPLLARTVKTGYAWVDPYWVSTQWRSGHYYAAGVAVVVKVGRVIKKKLGIKS